jgi:hypothetical protein
VNRARFNRRLLNPVEKTAAEFFTEPIHPATGFVTRRVNPSAVDDGRWMRWDGLHISLGTPREFMNIPPTADTVIVFTSILAGVLVDDFRSNGIRLSIEWGGDALLIAVLVTIGYVLWCAVCRCLAPPPQVFNPWTCPRPRKRDVLCVATECDRPADSPHLRDACPTLDPDIPRPGARHAFPSVVTYLQAADRGKNPPVVPKSVVNLVARCPTASRSSRHSLVTLIV